MVSQVINLADLVLQPESHGEKFAVSTGEIGIRAARSGSHHDSPTFRARGRLAAADYWDGE